ncbi:MAG: DnaJ domain-containing protein [Deltaproteobacteria bacterium]|nr:DnaJ domain-containing protein [Deltaproteobacteria bacterium]
MKNYYSILEIQENASETLIKSQYKKLAFIYHPDKNPNNTDKFMDLNKAYKTLIDPILREYYNRDLREFNKLKESQPGDKIIPYRTRLRDGGNINIEMDFTDDILDSTNNELIAKTLILQRYIRCPDCDGEGKKKDTLARVCAQCNGYGMVKNRETKVDEVCQSCNGYGDIFFYKCETCNGMGRIKKSEEITLNFKKEDILSNNIKNTHSSNNTDSNSIVNNKIIVFNGKGDEGVFGGKNGNIVVLIKINNEEKEKESFFKRLFLNKK